MVNFNIIMWLVSRIRYQHSHCFIEHLRSHAYGRMRQISLYDMMLQMHSVVAYSASDENWNQRDSQKSTFFFFFGKLSHKKTTQQPHFPVKFESIQRSAFLTA